MHPTALMNCQAFMDCYAARVMGAQAQPMVVEIGSRDVNGSLRSVCPPTFAYTGVDFAPGKGVDIVLDDPYTLPFASGSVDIVMSSSVFEHSEMFWLLFLEVLRILKPAGLFYLNAPSNGDFHRYPVDCWRFYPDSGRALANWAKRSGLQSELLESYTSDQYLDQWSDFVAVFLKDAAHLDRYPGRILHTKQDIRNGVLLGRDDFLRPTAVPEDRERRP